MLGLDALGSAAYGPEAALTLLIPLGAAGVGYIGPISTLIIALSMPLSVISSLAILSAIGETINLMTLGGLSLAVDILVDDATV